MESEPNHFLYKINKSNYIKKDFKERIWSNYDVRMIGISGADRNKIVIYVLEVDFDRLKMDFKEEIDKNLIEIVGCSDFKMMKS
jgi:hypothetical protein